MSLLVDTSVWLLLSGDQVPEVPQVRALIRALETGERLMTTGLVLQELLQGFSGAKARDQIVDRFSAFPLLAPDREDHIAAATLRNLCRKRGAQVGTIDALLAQLCIRHELTLLSTDEDFAHMARHCPCSSGTHDSAELGSNVLQELSGHRYLHGRPEGETRSS